jgi:hypothetical protein
MVLGRDRKKGSNVQQVGILFDQIFDPPKKLKRANGLRDSGQEIQEIQRDSERDSNRRNNPPKLQSPESRGGI